MLCGRLLLQIIGYIAAASNLAENSWYLCGCEWPIESVCEGRGIPGQTLFGMGRARMSTAWRVPEEVLPS
jgi:hypothetical protein